MGGGEVEVSAPVTCERKCARETVPMMSWHVGNHVYYILKKALNHYHLPLQNLYCYLQEILQLITSLILNFEFSFFS